MGVDAGDYDNDGRLDFVVTAYQRELTTLYRNQGGGPLHRLLAEVAIGRRSFNHVKWGVGLVDFDNDGHRDLFIACGHVDDNAEQRDDTTSYFARNVLLRNTGDGRFVDVSSQCGDGMAVKLSSRGAALDDLDNDGRVDVVVLNSRREPTVLRNVSPTGNHYLQIRLRGVRTNRDGVGASVKVVAGDLAQVDEVHSGRGYQSHWGTRLHFGLGKHTQADRIEVRWIGGGVDVIENIAADGLVTIVEGSSESTRSRTL